MEPTTLAVQAVGGFTVGALIGYAVRKITKWLLLAIGFMLLPVFVLWYLGVLNVNWEGVNELIGQFLEWLGVNISNMTTAMASTGTLGVSWTLGFLFGVSGGFRHTVFPLQPECKYVRRRGEKK